MFVTAMCYSQAITVDTSRSANELVTNVLINSSCTEITNIQSRTGTNFGSVNGIGYFENTNPNFPMQSGVILSTGNVANAHGPNSSILNDGNSAWTGDTDLENILRQAGISMNSVNASVLEFDFTPISPNFSFDFLFASEEYGNFQCDFSDAFAFLLTNLNTGETQNLAVIPNTTTPISVLTIRDFLYNSICPSVNPEYFGSFNGGSQSLGSTTNFNGQTVVLKASSVLIPNTPYHIKLVIADRSDFESDSAIFLSANSFNVGQEVLGNDLTIASNTALCKNNSHTLETGLSTSDYNFIWTQDGAIITGPNASSLDVFSAGTYTVTYNSIAFPCENPTTDSIIVEFYPELVSPNPKNIYKCNTGQSAYDFDLSYNNSVLLNGLDSGVSVSYHISENDAKNNINPLPNIRQSAGNETIFASIKNTNGCVTVKSFELLLIAPPTAFQPNDLTGCSLEYNSDNASFAFSSQDASVLNGQSSDIFEIKYYLTLEDAQNGTGAISNANYIASNDHTIFVRIENKTDTGCYATTSFKIFVKNIPPVDNLISKRVCDEFVLPALVNGNYFTGTNGTGTPHFAGEIITESQTIYIFNQSSESPFCTNESSFRITVIDPEAITPNDDRVCTSYMIPSLEYGAIYTQPGGQGTLLASGTVITESQTIYVYYQFPEEPFCVVDTSFHIEIIPFQPFAAMPNVFDCDAYVLPNLPYGNYYTQTGGNGSIIPDGTTISATQTIFAYVENDICNDEKVFTVFIGLTPPANAENCSNYVLPALPIGNYFTGPAGTGTQIAPGTIISQTQRIYIYVETADVPNCTDTIFFDVTISDPFPTTPDDVTECGKYILPSITIGNYYTEENGGGAMLSAGTEITSTQRIYIYKPVLPGQNCTNQVSYLVTINPLPQIDSRADIGPICNSYTLTPLTTGNYYTESGGQGRMLAANSIITETQTIYIYGISNTNPPCSAENSFTITIIGIEADSPDPVTACDSYTLPTLTVGDYFTETGGNGRKLLAGEVISASQTLFIYAETDNRGQTCSDENLFPITIAQTPVVNPISVASTTVCDNDTINDGITAFDLTSLIPEALGSQSPSEYAVTFYGSEANAQTMTNPLTTSTLKRIFVRVSSIVSSKCFDVLPITIVVHKIPDPVLNGGTVCINSTTSQVIKTHRINTGLSMTTHTFQWFLEGNLIANAAQNFYVANAPGFYSVIATSKLTQCPSKAITVEVIRSEKAVLSVNVTDGFESNQVITVIAAGIGGDYMYQLDSGPFQESNVFTNVASGEHIITVRDMNGCEDASISAYVLNYPKFFTPNGDGFNDTWNIKDLADQPLSVIRIFDRYGKLLKEIKPSDHTGWDGYYNGNPMFGSDYWFVVTYVENGISKEFRAHFSLKR